MTNEQIRGRCEKALESIITFDLPTNEEAGKRLFARQTTELESLCREMMAAGLEMAAGKADKYPCNPEARRGMASLADWCRQEAQRVKENHGTKKC